MKRKDIINVILFLLVLAICFYTYKNKKFTFKKSRITMDTIVEITATSKNNNVENIIDSTFQLIDDYDKKFSFYEKGSKLWDINHSTNDSFDIDNDFYEILSISDKLFKESDEMYDVTIGALSKLWNFNKTRIPSIDSIKTAQKNIGFDKIQFTKDRLIKPKNIELNFGSIAKGFIIDKAVEFMKKHHIISGVVNAGGDIRIFGYKKFQKIGIQHPRKKNEVIEVLKMKNGAIVTSGDYERYFILNGIKYHHILNPKTGFPSKNAISVTVIAPNATIADAYSTALFLMGSKESINIVNRTDSLEEIIFTEENGNIKRFSSSGIAKYLEN